MKESTQRAYARLIARVGANVQKDQGAVIYAQPEIYRFVRLVAEEAYSAGAGWVEVLYSDQPLDVLAYGHQSPQRLKTVPRYLRERQRFFNKELPAEIYLISEDPDGMRAVDQRLLASVRAARSGILKPLRDERENKNQWTIAAVPGEDWAKKVFPDKSPKQAVEALWEAILSAARVTEDPAAEWARHNAALQARADRLNAYGFRKLRIRSASTGTDLVVGLIDGALWLGGAEKTLSGTVFNPNLPTEEVFTTPMRGAAEGRAVSTKPLSFGGQVIDRFEVVFEHGRAVSCRADKGQALLENMLGLDENAPFLGEVALIGQDSSINQSGILFYETLFDENASCHLALGAGFTNVLPDFADLSLADAMQRGVNDSVHHTDFMIGAPDLSVVGVTPRGDEVRIFENGCWVI